MPKKLIIQENLWRLTFVSLLFFVYLMSRIVWPYTSGEIDIDFLLTKQFYVHLSHYRWSFYLHIFSSLFVLASGLSQFSQQILIKQPTVHRWIGKIYIGSVLFISAPAALIMSFYANGSTMAMISFILLSLLWWWFTLQGFRFIRKGNVLKHRAYMIRSYALTLSAITLRAIQFLVIQYTSWDYHEFYNWNAWISWTLNIIAAEWYIRNIINARTGTN